MLELAPIIKSLWRSKIGPLLIIAQLALSIAIISNALFFIQERIEHITRPTGFAHSEVSRLQSRQSDESGSIAQTVQRDIAVLEGIPGVKHAAPISRPPFGGGQTGTSISNTQGEDVSANMLQVNLLFTDHRNLDALGMRLVDGRNFHPEEVFYGDGDPPESGSAVITESVAAALFPDHPAVGQTLYLGGEMPILIVGVVENVMGSNSRSRATYDNLFLPAIFETTDINYLVRSEPEDRYAVMDTAAEKLRALDSRRIINNVETMETLMSKSYRDDYAMITLLSIVLALLMFINMLGIVGITTFWVNQRRKQIGIRRALGATRTAIMRYFLLENALLVAAATLAGAMIAFWISHHLVRYYAFAVLPWQYIPLAGVVLLAITLAATAVPAQRAARVSPQEAVAIR